MRPAYDNEWVQLATRIPKTLHRSMKLHCVQAEVSVMEFVTTAVEEKLGRGAAHPGRRQGKAVRRKG